MDQSPTEFVSQLKPFSLCIVLEDKPYDSDTIKAFPAEHMFNHEGGVDKEENTITAEWLQGQMTNRYSSPDVCVGESVQVYRYADTDKYYWTTFKREPALRKKEKALYLWSNVPRGSDDTAGPYNSYWAMVSAVDGIVHFHTPANDGEACIYDITIRTKEGLVTVADGLDNTITLNSKSGKLMGDIKNEIVLQAGQSITLAAPKITTVGETFTAKASASATMDTPITNTKAMSVGGDIDQSGKITSSGDHTAAGFNFA